MSAHGLRMGCWNYVPPKNKNPCLNHDCAWIAHGFFLLRWNRPNFEQIYDDKARKISYDSHAVPNSRGETHIVLAITPRTNLLLQKLCLHFHFGCDFFKKNQEDRVSQSEELKTVMNIGSGQCFQVFRVILKTWIHIVQRHCTLAISHNSRTTNRLREA